MAVSSSQAQRGPTRLVRACSVLLLIVSLAAVREAASADESHFNLAKKGVRPPPPTKLVLYEHEDRVDPGRTVVTSAAPGGNYATLQFGTINVIANVVREGQAASSKVLGKVLGQVTFEDDLSLSLAYMFVLNTTSHYGTLTVQGTLDATGNGEVVITGGTYDFRFARGYAEVLTVSSKDQGDVVFKNTLHLKYD